MIRIRWYQRGGGGGGGCDTGEGEGETAPFYNTAMILYDTQNTRVIHAQERTCCDTNVSYVHTS